MNEQPGVSVLLDRGTVAREYGLARVDIDRAFRSLAVVALPGSRKVYVRRTDLEEWIDEHTYDAGRVRPVA